MRLGAWCWLLVLTVVVQVALFPHLRLAGRVPDLGLVVAVAVAFDHGPEAGAIVGFLAGLGFDLFLETPLGLTALAYALTAYAVGVLQGGVLRTPKWFTPVIGVGGVAGGLLFVGVGLLAGVDGVHGNQAFVTVALAAAYDALLAPFVFILVGAWLRDPRERLTWSADPAPGNAFVTGPEHTRVRWCGRAPSHPRPTTTTTPTPDPVGELRATVGSARPSPREPAHRAPARSARSPLAHRLPGAVRRTPPPPPPGA